MASQICEENVYSRFQSKILILVFKEEDKVMITLAPGALYTGK